jgi:hypothetical protein
MAQTSLFDVLVYRCLKLRSEFAWRFAARCQHSMELKGVKPGVFHPRCIACKEICPDFSDATRACGLNQKIRMTMGGSMVMRQPRAGPKPRMMQTVKRCCRHARVQRERETSVDQSRRNALVSRLTPTIT